VISRGSVWWVDLGEPVGSQPGFVRPAVIVSADAFNNSAIATVVVVAITSSLRLGEAPGNVALPLGAGGLPKSSVVNVSQVATIDKASLIEEIGRLTDEQLESVERGLRMALTL
jgi:mRNA interferase MazF